MRNYAFIPASLLLILVAVISGCTMSAVKPTVTLSATLSLPSETPTLVPSATVTPTSTQTELPTLTLTPTITLTPTPTLAPAADFMKGVAFTSWASGEYSSAWADRTLAEVIRPMGSTWVEIIVTCYQDKIDSTTIYCPTDSNAPSDADLVHVIEAAHNLGLRVMLKPHLDLSKDPTHWRGDIGFGSKEEMWKIWFMNYTNTIIHYAELAEKNEVDYFVVGTELGGTSHRTKEWKAIIAEVKKVYKGPLTYAANWGKEAERVVLFWDVLDAIGVDAYYPLAANNKPTLKQLKSAWSSVAARLKAMSIKYNHPILFTEVGYRSVDGAARAPWDFTKLGTVDLQEQADCYQALIDTFSGQEWWGGVFWWSWSINPLQGGSADQQFNANQKPAEDILRAFYGAPTRPTATPIPIFSADESKVLVIYRDGLGDGWEDWSSNATIDLKSTDIPRDDKMTAIKVNFTPGGALSLHHTAVDTTGYAWLEIEFYFKTKPQPGLMVRFYDAIDQIMPPSVDLNDGRFLVDSEFAPGRWQRIRIPLGQLGADALAISRIDFSSQFSLEQQGLYIAEIRLIAAK